MPNQNYSNDADVLDIGEIHLAWEFPEFVQHKRGKWWYIIAAIILAGFVFYSVMTSNFLFVVILLLGVFVLIYRFLQGPRPVTVKIGQDGILVDRKLYPYKELKSFWLIYEPPTIKYLYFDFKNRLKKHLPVPLEDINPLQVRESLLNYLEEDLEKEEEGFSETLSRFLRIH